MARIDLVDLAHSYGGNAAAPESFALKPVSMTWRQGGAYALLGPSGCGQAPLKNRGVPKGEIDARVAEIARLLDLTPFLDRKATRLTADAKQKISLGRGLVRSDVAAVLFDEPLTVIDPELKWQLRSKLKALHRDLDLTMIYVTHDQTEALTFADTVVVMHDGRVVQSGTPAELFDKPATTFAGDFLGSPRMEHRAAGGQRQRGP